MGLYHRVHGCVSYGAWVCIIHGGYGVHHTVDTSQKSGIEECHSHDIDEDSSDTDRDIWDPRWMLMRIKAISRMAFISEGVWRIEEEMLFRGCMTQLICYYLIHGNHVIKLDERMNKEFKEDIRRLLNVFQVVEHPDEMQKDGISLPRLAFVFQGLTARIRLAIGKAKGEDLIEPRGQYGRMPKLFELRELAGTAALYGFEAEHLQWVLDRDEKTNPKPNPGKVKRNHRTASRMEDFHVDLNAATYMHISKLLRHENPEGTAGDSEMKRCGKSLNERSHERIDRLVAGIFRVFSPYIMWNRIMELEGTSSYEAVEKMQWNRCRLIAHYLLHGDNCLDEVDSPDLAAYIKLLDIKKGYPRMSPEVITPHRMARLFQGLAGETCLYVFSKINLTKPSRNYGSIPPILELQFLSGTASLFGFEAEYLQSALDFDKRKNPHPNADRVRRNTIGQRMCDYHIWINRNTYKQLSNAMKLPVPECMAALPPDGLPVE
eukprot:GHVO01018494.1.p1 GENE.GHVO01018494.1~~GHVO01018494.1.p1  ORF type:complete len:490 (+),score=62.53 GHVO01018494.1:123-1592(+)